MPKATQINLATITAQEIEQLNPGVLWAAIQDTESRGRAIRPARSPERPQYVTLYVRQSDARDDKEKGGIDYHVKILMIEAIHRGWGILRVVIENDVPDGKGGTKRKKSASAFRRKKVTLPNGQVVMRVIRPRFHETIADMWSGRSDGMLAVELDRAMRDPRDLEDLIDVVQAKGLNAGSIGGTLEFTNGGTDDEIDRARFLVMMANRESRTRRNRTRRYRERDAHLAKGHGVRMFGWTDDYKTAEPLEAAVIVKCYSLALLDNWQLGRQKREGSLRQLAAMLREGTLLKQDNGQGIFVPTVTGAPWSAEGLKEILIRDRNAGLVVLRDEVQEGRVGEWDALIDIDTHQAVKAKLTDPARATNSGGRERRHLGSGEYLCGKCDNGSTSVQVVGGDRSHRYRCQASTHLGRQQNFVDTLVKGAMVELLTDGALGRMLSSNVPSIDMAKLRKEKRTIQEQLNNMAGYKVLGQVSEEQFLSASKVGNARIAEINEEIKGGVMAASSDLAAIANAQDPAEAWLAAPLMVQQAIMRELITVTILPSNKKLDPNSVRIERKSKPVTHPVKRGQLHSVKPQAA